MSLTQVGLLAKLIEEHLGGSAKTNSSYRMAFEQEAMQIKRKNKSYVILIGQLTHGIARHRALLFKVRSFSDGVLILPKADRKALVLVLKAIFATQVRWPSG